MNCDKCGHPVAQHEDATWLDAIANDNPVVVLFSQARHIRCSPSRAQFIVHPAFEPVVDDRPEYDKRLLAPKDAHHLEAHYTQAWIQLQQHCGLEV